jgi:hypothetical protein
MRQNKIVDLFFVLQVVGKLGIRRRLCGIERDLSTS